MAISKFGSKMTITAVATQPVTPSVTPPVTGNVTPPQKVDGFSGEVIEKIDKKNFLYFWARAISAGETSGANGNGDWFPLEELVKAYGSFKGRGLYLNHNSDDVTKAVGKIVEAQIVVDKDTKEIWVECLCKIDRILHAAIARQIETKVIDSVSMGCTCDEAQCSVCDRKMTKKEDFCEHMTSGLLREFEKQGKIVQCYSINRGINFTELSLVSVPADGKAKIHELIASLNGKNQIEKTAALNEIHNIYLSLNNEDKIEIKAMLDEKVIANNNLESGRNKMEKESGKTETSQKEVTIKTTSDEQDLTKDLAQMKKLETAKSKIETTLQEQEELKTVLQKLNALDYMRILSHIEKRSEEGYMSTEKAPSPATQLPPPTPQTKEEKSEKMPPTVPEVKDINNKNLKDIECYTESDYKEYLKRQEEIAKATAQTKVDPEVKDLKTDIMDRVSSKLTTKLFLNTLTAEIRKTVDSEEAVQKLAAQLLPEFIAKIAAGAKPGSKEYYYFNGGKEPKPTDLAFNSKDKEGLYTSEHQGKDVTQVEKGTSTADYEKQLNEKDKKDEWSRAHDEAIRKYETDNKVEQTKNKMGLGSNKKANYTALLFKKAELADSKWVIFEDGKIVAKATLGGMWKDKLSTVADWATSKEYRDELITRLNTDGLDSVKAALGLVAEPESKAEAKAEEKAEAKKEEAKEEKKEEAKEKKEEAKKEAALTPKAEKTDDALPPGITDALKEGPKDSAMPMPEPPPPMPEDKPAGMSESQKESPSDVVIKELMDLYSKVGGKEESLPPRGKGEAATEFESRIIKAISEEVKGKSEPKSEAKEPTDEKPKKSEKEKEPEAKSESKEEKKSEKEAALNAELAAEKIKSALREKVIRARSIVEGMVERGMIEPDEKVMAQAQKNGVNIIDSRNTGLKAAIDNQLGELIKMDDKSLSSFAGLVSKMKVTASMKSNVLSQSVNGIAPESPSSDNWIEQLPWS